MANVIITKNYLHELFQYREGKLYWKVALTVDKKSVLIGYFGDLDLAGLVAKEARIKHHGEFARHE